MDLDKKSIAQLSAEEIENLVEGIAKVYEKYGFPRYLREPMIHTRYQNTLHQGYSRMNKPTLTIQGVLPPDQAELRDQIWDDLARATETIKDVTLELNCGYSVGMQMAPIQKAERIHVKGPCTGEITVAHEKGKVTLLSFWLPPHMAPKADETPLGLYQAMVERNGQEWKDRVRLIGVSDHELEEIQTCVADCKQQQPNVELYHLSNQVISCGYEMKGFPHICLVDSNGMIVFAGYPSDRQDIEQDIRDLLKGEKLTGRGALDRGWTAANSCTDEQVAQLLQETQELVDDEIKLKIDGVTRAFLNYDVDQYFNMKTRKTSNEVTVWTILTGQRAAVTDLQQICTKLTQGLPCKHNDQISKLE